MSEAKSGQGGHVHIPALDGIRGSAILLVFAHHIAQSISYEFGAHGPAVSLLHAGWVGVDLFFVLSGFLITGILVSSKGQPHFFRNFYMRRTLRIFPLYYFTLIVVFLMGSINWPEPAIYGDGSQWWLWAYMANVATAFYGFGQFEPIDHFWSLAIEEQFYLVWPFVVWAFSTRTLIRILIGVIIVCFFMRLGARLGGVSADSVYVFTPFRADSLGIGALLALFVSQVGHENLAQYRSKALVVFALTLLGMALLFVVRSTSHTDIWMQTIGFTTLSFMCASMILVALTQPVLNWVFSISWLRWFGKYSYGLYVWHPIAVIIILHTTWGRELRGGDSMMHALVSTLVAIIVPIIITYLSWHLSEKRLLSLKRYFPSHGS